MIQFSFFIVHIGVYHIPDVLFNHTDVSDIPLNYCTFICLVLLQLACKADRLCVCEYEFFRQLMQDIMGLSIPACEHC